jgi:hypothetical protein
MMFKFLEYFPHGPQTNVALSTVTQGGWTECFTAYYNYGLDTKIASILSACSGSKLMMACKPTNSSTIQLLAWAPRDDVLFQTSAVNPKHYVEGPSWYFSTTKPYSWGFAKEGDDIKRAQCDYGAPVNGKYRLCWHTNDSKGFRCGEKTYPGSSYERMIFHR